MKTKIVMFLTALFIAISACKEDDPDVVACFNYSPEQSIKVGDTVYFSNCSQEALEYAWNFGDADNSTEAEPYHIYTQPGTYTVTLVATHGGVTENVSKEIKVAKEVVACFTISPEENVHVGDTVYFTNCSEEATDYAWEFGDSETSSEAEPFHIFSQPGDFEVSLTASKEDDSQTVTQNIKVTARLSYIINYGSFSGDKSTITAYNNYTNEVENGYYETVNEVSLTSNVQYAYSYNNNIYMMGNNADGVSWVDEQTFKQTKNAITTDIVKPRYCVGKDDYLYVSCWGGDIWTDESLSYIAKINLTTSSVEKKISLPGGPEGLAIANNKLYAALGYKDSIAVIDLNSEAISYIETQAVSSYFLKDNNDNLYVSFVSTWSDPSTSTGLGYINTTNDQLEATYTDAGMRVSSGYVNVMAPNADFSKIYVVMEGANYGDPGAISVFDIGSKSFKSNKFLEDVSGINGVGFDDNKVFCFISESVTGNGKAITYAEDGIKLEEYETGIAPFMILKTN